MPADCVLVEGTVVVDEAMITGEPLPVAKTAPGAGEALGRQHRVFGGTEVPGRRKGNIRSDGRSSFSEKMKPRGRKVIK